MSNSPLIVNGPTQITLTRGTVNNRTRPIDIFNQLNTADSTQTDFERVALGVYRLGKPIIVQGFFNADGATFICVDGNQILARSGANWIDGYLVDDVPAGGSTYFVEFTTPAFSSTVQDIVAADQQDVFLQWYGVVYKVETGVNLTLLKNTLESNSALCFTVERTDSSADPSFHTASFRYQIPTAADNTVRVDVSFVQLNVSLITPNPTNRITSKADNVITSGCDVVILVRQAGVALISGLGLFAPTSVSFVFDVEGLSSSNSRLFINDLGTEDITALRFAIQGFATTIPDIDIGRTIVLQGTYPTNDNIDPDTTGVAIAAISSLTPTASTSIYGYFPSVEIPAANNTFTETIVLRDVITFRPSTSTSGRAAITTLPDPIIRLRKFGYLEDSVVLPLTQTPTPQTYFPQLCIDDAIEISLAGTQTIFGVTISAGNIAVNPAFVGSLVQFYSLIHAEYAEQQNIYIPIGVRRFGQRYEFSARIGFISNASLRGPGETIILSHDLVIATSVSFSPFLIYPDRDLLGMVQTISSFSTATGEDDSIFYRITSGTDTAIANSSGPVLTNISTSLGNATITAILSRTDNANVFLAPLNSSYDLRIVRPDSAISVTQLSLAPAPFELLPTYNVIPSLGGLTLTELNAFIAQRSGTWTFTAASSPGGTHFLVIRDAGEITIRDIALSIQNVVYNAPSSFTEHPFNYTPGLLNMPRVLLSLTGNTFLNDPSETLIVATLIFQFTFLAHVRTTSGRTYMIIRVSNIGDNTFSYLNADLSLGTVPTRISSSTDSSGTPVDTLGAVLFISSDTAYTIVLTSPRRRPRRVEYDTTTEFLVMESLENEADDINYSLDTTGLYDGTAISNAVIQTSNVEVTTSTGIDHTLNIGLDSTSPVLISSSESRKVFYDIKQNYNYIAYLLRNGQHGESIIIGENTITISGLIVISRDPTPTTLNDLQFEIGLVTQLDRDALTPRKSNNLRVEFIPSFGFESGRSIALNVAAQLREDGIMTIRNFIELKDV